MLVAECVKITIKKRLLLYLHINQIVIIFDNTAKREVGWGKGGKGGESECLKGIVKNVL